MGRFQYTGQTWLPELGLNYYKARMYAPHLGRFPPPDPIGYGAGPNLYAYVGNDPINWTDPLGLGPYDAVGDEITVISSRYQNPTRGWAGLLEWNLSHQGIVGYRGVENEAEGELIVVTGRRPPKRSWGHRYSSYRRVAGPGCKLSDAEDAYLTQHFSTPFAPGKAAIIGRVDLPGLISANPIFQRVTGGGQGVVNVTLPGHVLHSDQGGGRVTRAVVIGPGGAVYSSTIGTGTNYDQFLAGANQLFGPAVFSHLDMAMSAYIAESGICN